MAKKKKKKKKKKIPAQASGSRRRRLRTQRIIFTAFALLIVASFVISLIAQGF